MRLNLDKCSFGVQDNKFLNFMLTHQGIEANPDNWQTMIDMRSLTSIKEVQKLTGRLTALSKFLSCTGDKSIHFFAAIKKSSKFVGIVKCEKEFVELKQFLSTPLIFVRPKDNLTLTLHLAASEKAINSVLVQEDDNEERSVYFVSKVLKATDIRY